MKIQFWLTVVAFIFVFLNLKAHSQTVRGVNVALHRQTNQSSTYLIYGSDRAVDGNTSGNLENGHCTHTSEDDHNPWFQVTFPKSNITSIEIYNRGEFQQRLNGFKLELYNGDSLVLTYTDQDVNPQSIYRITYDPSLTASKAFITQSNIIQGDPNPFLTICEIEIIGDIIECDAGFYGDDCFDPCSSHCSTTTCDRRTGNCTCKLGYTGTKCDRECPSGYFGVNCLNQCSTHCNSTCNNVDGHCTCKPGYTGDTCHQACPLGYLGANCTLISCKQTDNTIGTYGMRCNISDNNDLLSQLNFLIVIAII